MSEWVRPGLRAAQLATVLVAAVLLTGCGSNGKTSRTTTSAQSLVAIGAGLRGPSGLHATVYANGLKLMSAFAFDARGRLWVTTSGANTHTTDGLYVVSRAGARPIRIAGTFRGPLGLVWVRGRLYRRFPRPRPGPVGPDGRSLRSTADDPHRAAGRRREQQPHRVADREARHGSVGFV